MKRWISVLLALALTLSIAACGRKPAKVEEVPVLEMMEKIWEGMPAEPQFPCMGGDFETAVEGKPGDFSDREAFVYALYVPENLVDKIEACASVMHMLNSNSFTGAGYQLKDGDDVERFSKDMENALKNNRWICGIPEEYFIAALGKNVVVVFGLSEIVDGFSSSMKNAYPGTNVLYSGSLQ